MRIQVNLPSKFQVSSRPQCLQIRTYLGYFNAFSGVIAQTSRGRSTCAGLLRYLSQLNYCIRVVILRRLKEEEALVLVSKSIISVELLLRSSSSQTLGGRSTCAGLQKYYLS